MTYPMGGRILPIERNRLGLSPSVIELATEYLASFGWMRVPAHLWRAMRRNAAWIEPTLIAEWARLMREYAKGQERQLAAEEGIAAMRWSDPKRDVSRAKEIAEGILDGERSAQLIRLRHGAPRRLSPATMMPCPRRSPHSISCGGA
jgi:hypothetical protein